jgi:excinuclease ABC subunit A
VATDTGRDLFIEGARQNNLKNISLRIPHNAVTVITGVSGSGKSSLAFNTLFAEGQWRYIESLSTYARMFLEKVDRPDVDRIVNIRPAIAIEQSNPIRTARSTVGTATEIADLLRLLFAKVGHLLCPDCDQEARSFSPDAVADDLLSRCTNARAMILFRIPLPAKGQDRLLLEGLRSRGFSRLKYGEDLVDLLTDFSLPTTKATDLFVVLDRLVLRPEDRSRLVEAVETAFREADGHCRVEVIGQGTHDYSRAFQCQRCGRTFESPRPILFSFNHPLGACPTCKGFGNILKYDENLVVPDRSKTLADGAIEPWTKPSNDRWFKKMLLAMKRRGVSLTTPYAELSEEHRTLLWQGHGKFEGINQFFEYLESKRYKMHVRVMLSRYRNPVTCPTCSGTRLKPDALFAKVGGLSITDVTALTVDAADQWLDQLTLSPFEATIAKDLLRQLRQKLSFLLRVGLSYLTLDRETRTLSGGEAQRITLANQLGSRLVGTLYVLDEPTIGLHARDTAMLASILKDLAEAGNTVVVVEHDPIVMHSADYLVEMGPRSGEQGGTVVCALPRKEFLDHPDSLTAAYLRGDLSIPLPNTRRTGSGKALLIAGAQAHNLKNVSVRFPLHTFTCVTGVSGSGKSTLVEDTLYRALARTFRVESLPLGRFRAIKGVEHLRGVRLIDQQPIGRTPRSNPITYLKAFDEIRGIFAIQLEARRQGLTPAHFSFNTPGGRCERCEGNGFEKLEMYFFEDLYVTCEACNGTRYGQTVLGVTYKNKSIHDVLRMTFDEARAFFTGTPRLADKLAIMSSIGLGYLRLGQPATTLSGGEAQRLKIAAELKDPSAKDQLYILDEPTTGLHLDDISRLLVVLNKLVDAGNTLIVVEHNLDVIKTADWVIDLGPEGGNAGGALVAEGTPEQVALVEASHTGRFLKPLLTDC